jgi:hypothetical protein
MMVGMAKRSSVSDLRQQITAWKHDTSRRFRNAATKASWLSRVVESACRQEDSDSAAAIQREYTDIEGRERERPLQRQNLLRPEAFA